LASIGFVPGNGRLRVVYVISLAALFLSANLLNKLAGVGQSPPRTPVRKFQVLLWVVAAALLASTLVAWTRGYLNKGTVTSVAVFLASGAVVYYMPRCFSDSRSICRALYAMAVSVALLAVLWFPGMLAAVGKHMVMPVLGTRVGLNNAGGTFGMLVVLTFALLVEEKKDRTRLLLGVALVVLAAGAVLTKSRGAWVGAAAGLAYILVRTRRLKALFATMLAVPLAVSVVAPVRSVFLSRLSQTEAGDPSWLGRLFMWQTAARIIPRNLLFGIGLHNFGIAKFDYGFPRILDHVRATYSYTPSAAVFGHTHNMYIELLMDIGLVGFSALVVLLVLTVLRLDGIVRSRESTQLRGPALALAGSLIGYMTHSCFDYFLWQTDPLFVFAVFLALAFAVIAQHRAETDGVPRLRTSSPDPT
jgi:O-antigen ligase